jgi:hypothetical protein
MTDTNKPTLSVDEFVEYCRIQAGLLSGHIETMGTEADALLDEIDEETAEVRGYLEERSAGPTGPQSPNNPDDTATEVATIAELEETIEEKQTLVKAKQVRMQAFGELAAGYTDLAEELQSDVDDGQEAVERVIRFESDHDAPVYFEDRRTVYEAATTERESN